MWSTNLHANNYVLNTDNMTLNNPPPPCFIGSTIKMSTSHTMFDEWLTKKYTQHFEQRLGDTLVWNKSTGFTVRKILQQMNRQGRSLDFSAAWIACWWCASRRHTWKNRQHRHYIILSPNTTDESFISICINKCLYVQEN